jgi:serine/threonine protein kinase
VEHFEEDGALYLVMDRMPGVSLTEWRKKGNAFDETDVVRLLEQAAVVLEYLHHRSPPIVHRDLKPGNVIRRPDGSYAFVDFGAVRDRLRPEGGSTVVGTFGYMAPEQFQGRAAPASDVYAIGATALWMMTGQEPEHLPHKGLAVDVSLALGSGARPELVAVLSSMLEPDPSIRPSSIAPLLPRLGTRRRATGSAARRDSPRPSSDTRDSGPPPEAAINLLRVLRRFLPALWLAAGLAWLWLPAQSATSFTIGLAILSLVTRWYLPRPERSARRGRAGARAAAPRIRVVDHGSGAAPGEDVEPESDGEAAGPRRRSL